MKAKSSLGLILFPAFDWAISPTHPEREERLLYTRDQIMEEGLADVDGIHFFNPAVAVDADINRVHFCWPDAASVVPRSHRIAAGGVMRAFDAVLGGETDKAFALVRPPGIMPSAWYTATVAFALSTLRRWAWSMPDSGMA